MIKGSLPFDAYALLAISKHRAQGRSTETARGLGEKTFNTGICSTRPDYLQIAGGVMRNARFDPLGVMNATTVVIDVQI